MCTAKFGLTRKEAGRLTFREFVDLHRAYTENWNMERRMIHGNLLFGGTDEEEDEEAIAF